MSLQTKQLVKVKEAAQILNVDRHRMYELAREILPSGVVVRIGRQIRFDPDALQVWITKGGTKEGARRDAT